MPVFWALGMITLDGLKVDGWSLPAIAVGADGIIVGSDLKRDGYTWNQVDAARVQKFMRAAGRRPVEAKQL